mmetsp:Transcript_7421/g.9183  ORF Transcript_7421/g.9183 Transcript_7421/m.9183 type:complete len:210 (+) Transcript_7421:202-831(+)|eukprot:CAMPEP_0172488606 /NCGR_PEP_ID=MMETSP1066-20121228/18224_1 /TAXON_ID=671091 /ORGANISM="Coscinodiscus wailesii, Strain CCMP2513" /LENGTH=209 /DNA_ID=CAMNT_0013255929 /DNA_START=199 /DNA_END=828 /DNA_ORIENTATION=+
MLSSLNTGRAALTPTLLRTLSTTAASHKPPIDIHGLHGRYANATYIAASKAKLLPKVETELVAIKQSMESSPAFKLFMENPLISRDNKVKQISDMMKSKTTPVTLNLMTTLAGNARLMETGKIVDAYVELMKAQRGEVEATIISADALTKAQTEAVASAMKSQVGSDKKVVLSTKVDPSIIGGLQVQIGDKFLDLSVKSKIDAISRTPV